MFISKLCEGVVAVQLTKYLTDNFLMEQFQSAYKPSRSNESTLLKVQDDILQALDNDQYVILLLLDLSAAFDTVDHRILPARLTDRLDIDGKAHDWFKSYLGGRMNFGVVPNSTLSLDKHVTQICKSSLYSIKNTSRIRKFLSLQTAKILVHEFFTSKLDNCNSMLYGLPKNLLQRLQYVLNSAAGLVTMSRKSDHVTLQLLFQLHWLPVEQRFEIKVLLSLHIMLCYSFLLIT